MARKTAPPKGLETRIQDLAEQDDSFNLIDLDRCWHESMELLRKYFHEAGSAIDGYVAASFVAAVADDAKRARSIMISRDYKAQLRFMATISDKIVHILDFHDFRALGIDDVVERLTAVGEDAPKDTVKRTLSRLARNGRIQKTGRGMYASLATKTD